ncbi:hypothetical protein KC316_g23 [Hortaea werneckii]|nr:hypothetical protein KC316_g23 [Hortaea werneckii]
MPCCLCCCVRVADAAAVVYRREDWEVAERRRRAACWQESDMVAAVSNVEMGPVEFSIRLVRVRTAGKLSQEFGLLRYNLFSAIDVEKGLLGSLDGGKLPAELRQIIVQEANAPQYLEIITRVAQDARYTDLLFANCERIFAHVCASSDLPLLGRVVPFAHYLEPYVLHRLQTGLSQPPDDHDDLIQHLLAISRLLKCNVQIFKPHINLEEVQSLLRHPSKPVVYLAIRILQVLLDGADYWFEQMTREYLGEDDAESGIDGPWDAKVIDYRFLSLWEDRRLDEVSELLQGAEACQTRRVLPSDAFHPSTTLVGGFLFPVNFTNELQRSSSEDLVVTSTIDANVRAITSALRRPDPLLLSGLAGSGKSLLARHVARKLGKLDKMVTLHLNEQSDAKLLIGIYTTGDQPGTFVWKPGVLTTAVQEGRWILIEDLDRAPNEIIGTLLPDKATLAYAGYASLAARQHRCTSRQ